MTRVVVVGGGISGLAAAWQCSSQRLPVTLVDGVLDAGGAVLVAERHPETARRQLV